MGVGVGDEGPASSHLRLLEHWNSKPAEGPHERGHIDGLGLDGCTGSAHQGRVPYPVNSLSVLSSYLPGTLALLAVPPADYTGEAVLILCRAPLCVGEI